MKKQMKKLKLAKETLRGLDDSLRHVAGGLTIVTGCDYCVNTVPREKTTPTK
jgi:hypothetical protein